MPLREAIFGHCSDAADALSRDKPQRVAAGARRANERSVTLCLSAARGIAKGLWGVRCGLGRRKRAPAIA